MSTWSIVTAGCQKLHNAAKQTSLHTRDSKLENTHKLTTWIQHVMQHQPDSTDSNRRPQISWCIRQPSPGCRSLDTRDTCPALGRHLHISILQYCHPSSVLVYIYTPSLHAYLTSVILPASPPGLIDVSAASTEHQCCPFDIPRICAPFLQSASSSQPPVPAYAFGCGVSGLGGGGASVSGFVVSEG